MDFEIVAVDGFDTKSSAKHYWRAGSTSNRDSTTDPNEAAAECEGFVKWDGCTQFTVDAHVDSKESLWKLLAAIESARRECALEMGSAYMDRFEYGKEKQT